MARSSFTKPKESLKGLALTFNEQLQLDYRPAISEILVAFFPKQMPWNIRSVLVSLVHRNSSLFYVRHILLFVSIKGVPQFTQAYVARAVLVFGAILIIQRHAVVYDWEIMHCVLGLALPLTPSQLLPLFNALA